MRDSMQSPQSSYQVRINMSSRYSSKFEANTSELMGNLEDVFPWYDMHSDIFSIFKLHHTTTRLERVNK